MKRGRVAALAVGVIAAACSGDGGPLIALHLAYEEQRPDLEPADFAGKQIFLEKRPLISDPDIVDVSVGQQEGRVILGVELSPDGAERMRRATAESIGRRIAVVFDTEIINVPLILNQIDGGGQLVIPVATADEARAVIEKVRARWPRAPG